MTGRVLVWVGGVVAVACAAGLLVYFVVVGLDEADKLASVIGAFVGLAGLALAGYGIVVARRGTPPPSGPHEQLSRPDLQAGAGDTHNEVSDSTVHGPLFMGRDMNLSGGIHQHPAPRPTAGPPPQAEPQTGTGDGRNDPSEPPRAGD